MVGPKPTNLNKLEDDGFFFCFGVRFSFCGTGVVLPADLRGD